MNLIPSKKLPGVSIGKYDSLELKKDKEGRNKEVLWWHTAFDPMRILDPGDPCSASLTRHRFHYRRGIIKLSKLEEADFYRTEVNPSIFCPICGRHIWIHVDRIAQLYPYIEDGEKRLKELKLFPTGKLRTFVQKMKS